MMAFSKTTILPRPETILTALPMYHVFAFVVNLVGFYGMGAHNILIPNLTAEEAGVRELPDHVGLRGEHPFHGLVNEEWFVAHPRSISGVDLRWDGPSRLDRLPVGTGDGFPLVEGYGLTEALAGRDIQPDRRRRGPDGTGGESPCRARWCVRPARTAGPPRSGNRANSGSADRR